MRKYTVNQKSN